MAPAKSMDPRDLAMGGFLQCVEAATLGMPFEVWKTRMGRFRNEGTFEAFANVYKTRGVSGFWQGTGPKMVESASKGAILLFAKEGILNACLGSGMSPVWGGVLAGAGGGVVQTSVMGPCTFIVTAVVTADPAKKVSVGSKISSTYAEKGIKGFYPGASAIAARQATNWASRQGFTEYIRSKVKVARYGDEKAKLTVGEEAACGTLGGALATWNQPFEVARIQMQAAASEGLPKKSMVQTMSTIVAEGGPKALFAGIAPRVCLGIWQTLFMVTGAKIIKERMM
jgi:hypothetical protein